MKYLNLEKFIFPIFPHKQLNEKLSGTTWDKIWDGLSIRNIISA
jgi:hypothetical protein